MSKIKEAIDQQTEWYGIDTFAGLEELDQPTNTSHQARPTTRKVEKFVGQSNDGTGAQSQTTTTVTIEPLELDHTVLMTNPEHHYQPLRPTATSPIQIGCSLHLPQEFENSRSALITIINRNAQPIPHRNL
ncbi:hypothetical protein KEM48_004902 [Puccinia striiformis f. sp. tritici PST-130]|nr:hypothetical protein KEM48_004902 [Puccinia striiformis f. sp. tritici PST-130]